MKNWEYLKYIKEINNKCGLISFIWFSKIKYNYFHLFSCLSILSAEMNSSCLGMLIDSLISTWNLIEWFLQTPSFISSCKGGSQLHMGFSSLQQQLENSRLEQWLFYLICPPYPRYHCSSLPDSNVLRTVGEIRKATISRPKYQISEKRELLREIILGILRGYSLSKHLSTNQPMGMKKLSKIR